MAKQNDPRVPVAWPVPIVLVFGLGACGLEPVVPVSGPYDYADLTRRTSVRFAVLGDAGTGSAGQHAVAKGLAEVCGQEHCDFVVGTGDNIYEDGVDSVADPQLHSKFEAPYAYLGPLEFWMVLGNHDRRGSAQAQVDYTLESLRWRMPAQHYAIPGLPQWLTIYGVDTTDLSERQLRTVRDAVCNGGAQRFLFGHHPMYSHGEHGGSREVRKALTSMMGDCQVQAYFAGHDHHQEVIDAGGWLQIVEGAGAKVREVARTATRDAEGLQLFAAATLGFAILEVTPTSRRIRAFDADGAELFTLP